MLKNVFRAAALSFLSMLFFQWSVFASGSPGGADPQKTIDAVYSRLNNAVQGWALNKWVADGQTLSFTMESQPCYLTKIKSGSGYKRGCALPKPDYDSASPMNDVVWPSIKGSNSFDCLYKREVILSVVPQMLDNMAVDAAYRPVLQSLYSFAAAWKNAYPSLGLMGETGSCVIDYSRTPVEYQIQLPPH